MIFLVESGVDKPHHCTKKWV